MRGSLLTRLDAGDRALLTRWTIAPASAARRRAIWTAITHLGGTLGSLGAAAVPLSIDGTPRAGARLALATLVISHLLVQCVKRTVGRPRPSRGISCAALVAEPDRFSFPSGHAAAAMAVALGYAMAMPWLAPIVLPLAVLVGFSRVCLGVHYPGDVLVGQAIAVGTGLALGAIV